jgi:hypothetical protein
VDFIDAEVIPRTPGWHHWRSRRSDVGAFFGWTESCNLAAKELPEVQAIFRERGWDVSYLDGYVSFDMSSLPYAFLKAVPYDPTTAKPIAKYDPATPTTRHTSSGVEIPFVLFALFLLGIAVAGMMGWLSN